MSYRSQIDWLTEVVKGNVPNHTALTLRGINAALGVTTETIWPFSNLYTFPTSASIMTVSSNSTLDTLAGTGARTVRVDGLDTNGNQISENVNLNGTTGVNTVNSYKRVNDMIVISAGSTLTNQGRIFMGTGTITAGEPANVFNMIEVNSGISQSAFFSVPAGFGLLVYDLNAGVDTGKSVQLNTNIIRNGVLFVGSSLEIGNSLVAPVIDRPRLFREGDDFRMDGLQTSGGGGDSKVRLSAGLILYKLTT